MDIRVYQLKRLIRAMGGMPGDIRVMLLACYAWLTDWVRQSL